MLYGVSPNIYCWAAKDSAPPCILVLGVKNMSNEWFWEGNVVKTVCIYLQQQGWTIEKTADTESREAGVDIQASKDGEVLLVEIKGYPSTVYQRGAKKGLPKITNPSTQARHWYSEVLLSALLRQSANPTATVAIAFPEFPVFTGLVRRTRQALARLGIVIYLVKESGEILAITPEMQTGNVES